MYSADQLLEICFTVHMLRRVNLFLTFWNHWAVNYQFWFFFWGGGGFGQHNSFFIKTASRVLWSFVIHRRKMSARVLIHLYISWHFRKFWFHVYWVMGFLTLDDFLCFFLPSKKTLASLLPAVTINKSVQFIWNVLWEAVRLSRIECNNKMSTYR